MLLANATFDVNSASFAHILQHLQYCDENYVPSLSTKVDIHDYANKISEFADTVEAWSKDTLAGLIAVYMNDSEEMQAYITNVSVIEEFHGVGLAKKLMHKCFDLAENRGFEEICLEVSSDNARAISFYKKLGFNEGARLNDSVIMKRVLMPKSQFNLVNGN
jgi:ribosomal protein S18 acetylase RimI-like enzyme